MKAKKVLAIRLDSAGDVLLTGPAIRALAREAEVTLLCGPRGREAGELLPGPKEVLVYEACWIDPEPKPLALSETEDLVEQLRIRDFDQAVIFTSFHQSALPTAMLLRMAGVRTVAAISEDYPGSLLDVRHRISDDIHEVDRTLSLVATLGYGLPSHDNGRLQVKPTSLQVSEVEWDDFVVVHPGASVPARAWSPESYAELVQMLVAAGHRVVITGGPDEVALTSYVSGDGYDPSVLDLGGKLSLEELAALLARAGAVVVANTGPAHLAASVGTPVVSLFAPTVPAVRWRPWQVPQVLLGDQRIGCAGCRKSECPYPDHPCLSCVAPEQVLAALDGLIGQPANYGTRSTTAVSK